MKIEIFDIDNTLFRSPTPNRSLWTEEEYQTLIENWFGDTRSLSPPYVPEYPGPKHYNTTILQRAHQSLMDEDVHTIFMTGRREYRGFRPIIHRILVSAGLGSVLPKQVLLKTEGTTLEYKIGQINRLVKELHSKSVEMWEDRPNHVKEFRRHLAGINIKDATVNHVDLGEPSLEPDLERELAALIFQDLPTG